MYKFMYGFMYKFKFMYKFMYGFMYGFTYKFMYNKCMYKFMHKFMYRFMYRCLGSGPGPRPQWELGQDWDQGPARPGTRAQQLSLRPWGLGWIPGICT